MMNVILVLPNNTRLAVECDVLPQENAALDIQGAKYRVEFMVMELLAEKADMSHGSVLHEGVWVAYLVNGW
jgi:hypothetical protein